jgi:hypothetical protein
MKKKIFLGLVFICSLILIISLGSQLFTSMLNLEQKAGLKITSTPEAVVYLNGMEVGKTPFQDENLSAGEYLVKLSVDNLNWQGRIKLTKGTVSIINRLLSAGIATSSGETLILEKGTGVVIISSPSGSEVEVDGKIYGLTPISISNISSGEHNIILSHEGYLKRSFSVVLPLDLSLHINVDLAMTEVKLENLPTPTIAIMQKIIIKQTPLGYLRVREKPSVNSKEIGQVSSGDELEVVEELVGWIKIKLKDSQEGYVSIQYVQKLAQ